MQLALVISSLERGGAERVMVDVANGWVDRGWSVTIVTLAGDGRSPSYRLAEAVRLADVVVPLRPSSVLSTAVGTFRRGLRLRRFMLDLGPDVIVSFLVKVNVITLLACRGLAIPVVVAEHNDPASQPLRAAWMGLRRLTYGKAHRVVALTERALAALSPGARARGVVIPNPLSSEFLGEGGLSSVDQPVVAAMGRLCHQKGFDLSMRAFGRALDRVPVDGNGRGAWRLVIHGEGSERSSLQALRDELGLHDCVAMPGETDDPAGALRQASIFVLPSRWEGLPRVVAEAMACAVPVVAFDCRTGPAEMVQDGRTGYLVPAGDVEGMARALVHLMGDEALRRRLGAAGRAASMVWSLASVLERWDRDVFALVGSR